MVRGEGQAASEGNLRHGHPGYRHALPIDIEVYESFKISTAHVRYGRSGSHFLVISYNRI